MPACQVTVPVGPKPSSLVDHGTWSAFLCADHNIIGSPPPIVNYMRRGHQALSMYETLHSLSRSTWRSAQPTLSPAPGRDHAFVSWRFLVALTIRGLSHHTRVACTCSRRCAPTPVVLHQRASRLVADCAFLRNKMGIDSSIPQAPWTTASSNRR
jgi:hypothetical protein